LQAIIEQLRRRVAFGTLAKELERMPEIYVPILLPDRPLESFNRAGVYHQGYPTAFGTNDVIIVLLRIEQFKVTAGPIQENPLRNMQILQ
jgi:hypothetical protein